MTDLSDLFKRKHKIPGNNFGKILQPEAVDLRVKQLNVHRRKQRDSLLDGKRQMPNSPFVEDNNFTAKRKKTTAHEERIEKLKLWKHKRDNDRAEQRRKQKPVFKVCRAPDVIPIVESKLAKKDSKMATFAPANHLFNPPKNIKPQQFINGPVTRSRLANDVAAAASKVTQKKVKPPPKTGSKAITKATLQKSRNLDEKSADQGKLIAPEAAVIKRSTRKRAPKPLLEHSKPKALCKTNLSKVLTASEKLYNLRRTQIVTRSVKKQSLGPRELYVQNSWDEPSTSSTRLKPRQRRSQEKISEDSDSDQEMVTAESSCSTPAPVYMSPFVVLSRGKNNQRKEYHYRRKLTTDREMVIAETCCATPESVYMSPFIAVSRGKDNQRKEYHYRKNSTVGVDTPSPKSLEKLKNAMSSTTPKAAARHFTKVLDNTIADIQKLCDQWSLYRKEITSDEPCNMIDVAIGQSQLLMNNKFKQFRTLIKQCEFQTEKISCEDLHGFWDMLFIQVDNLQKRFDNLTALRNNDWIEVLPKPQATKRPKRKPAKAKAGSSCVRNAILKAKQTMNVQKTSTTAPRRSSGLSIMMATQNLKTVTPQKVRVQTPYRSILKHHSSESSHSKSVAFDEESEKENDLITFNTAEVETGVRRSTRRIRTKLF